MILGALVLVLAAALVHAWWNLLAKRSGGGAIFVLLFDLVSTVIYLPLAAIDFALERPSIGPVELGFTAGSGLLHATSFIFLQRAYRAGDLSLVYPVARGSGLLLATFGAIAVLAERPGAVTLVGAVFIAAGVFALGGRPTAARRAAVGRALVYAGLTGAAIAGYTLWDKYAVDDLEIPPLVYNWGEGITFALLLVPVAWHRLAVVRAELRIHRREIVGVGILSPLGRSTGDDEADDWTRELSLVLLALDGSHRWLLASRLRGRPEPRRLGVGAARHQRRRMWTMPSPRPALPSNQASSPLMASSAPASRSKVRATT